MSIYHRPVLRTQLTYLKTGVVSPCTFDPIKGCVHTYCQSPMPERHEIVEVHGRGQFMINGWEVEDVRNGFVRIELNQLQVA